MIFILLLDMVKIKLRTLITFIVAVQYIVHYSVKYLASKIRAETLLLLFFSNNNNKKLL